MEITHLRSWFFGLFSVSVLSLFVLVHGRSTSIDAFVMQDLKKSLNPSDSLGWTDQDHCKWQYVTCSYDNRVTQIQIGYLNLTGFLPPSLANLTALQTLDLTANSLGGRLPSLAGLSSLQYLFLSYNMFSSIPSDFFLGMTSLEIVGLDYIPFSAQPIPDSIQSASSLKVFSATLSNFTGKIPDCFGVARLTALYLASNNLEGGLPATFPGSSIEQLWLTGQNSIHKLNGSIAVIQNMTKLTELWLNFNNFSGQFPDFSRLTWLESFEMSDNSITGQVPTSLVNLPRLTNVRLMNSLLQGPTPKFNSSVTVDTENGSNSFCLLDPGVACDPRVNTLLLIAESVGYPTVFTKKWKGNDPCNNWLGISCVNQNITFVNFLNLGLAGTISPNFSSVISLEILILANNSLTGTIPNELTTLPNLIKLDVSNNRLFGQIPSFKSNVVVQTDGNPDLGKDGVAQPPTISVPPSKTSSRSGNRFLIELIVGLVIGGVFVVLLVGILIYCLYCCERKHSSDFHVIEVGRLAISIHVLRSATNNFSKQNILGTGGFGTVYKGDDFHVIEVGRLAISIHVLKSATNNFSKQNILGTGGFGTVYKGELHGGTKIAVKRMEPGLVNERVWDQFKSEIAVLSKFRHKHLVSLIGYCLDGNERLLVYEYMPQGTISRHLFRWNEEGLKALEWWERLAIALDVARGVEYMHGLGFIHRDLKPSNILLGDDMHAKVADFGFVRRAPNGKSSVLTKLAGTFGYLAPEYAVTGRVTVKVDVFSFGVILMQLITGKKAVVELETHQDECIGLVTWFRKMRMHEIAFHKAIDPVIDLDEETLASISIVAELAGHCCAKKPSQRPNICHAVNVLSSLVELWKPLNRHSEEGVGSSGELKLKDQCHTFQNELPQF
ncbi:receptor protein kinase TMK1-like isoform X2 [Camellia sinensis]|uniref:receptor protein kinase TMK1-like isoform X2 n=1 Tax=Camellia sinensis TaxID=4442 RepID=UPI0010362DAE|nr:receptor protein kinase TMK1-like isoform X2 [Camellia sinensis]